MSKTGFWESIVSTGKEVLSHVKLSFDGATRSIHIDIAPNITPAQIGPGQAGEAEKALAPAVAHEAVPTTQSPATGVAQ